MEGFLALAAVVLLAFTGIDGFLNSNKLACNAATPVRAVWTSLNERNE